MLLTSLPNELLSTLPLYMDDMQSFTNASSTCTLLRDNFAHTDLLTLIDLAANSSPTYFALHPHLLILATARQASDWVRADPARAPLLEETLHAGTEELLSFCLDHSRATVADMRRLHCFRANVIKPLASRIYLCIARHRMYGLPQWASPGDAERLVYQVAIYWELFGRGMEEYLAGKSGTEAMYDADARARYEYMAFCVNKEQGDRIYWGPGLLVPSEEGMDANPELMYRMDMRKDQLSMFNLYSCGRWRDDILVGAMNMVLGDEYKGGIKEYFHNEQWRVNLFGNALQSEGLQGMQLLTTPKDRISEECLEKPRGFMERIALLQEAPQERRIDGTMLRVPMIPDPLADLESAAHWQWRGMYP